MTSLPQEHGSIEQTFSGACCCHIGQTDAGGDPNTAKRVDIGRAAKIIVVYRVMDAKVAHVAGNGIR